MKTYTIAVTWEMCGYVQVEAKSLMDAMIKFRPDDHDLPVEQYYVDGSFQPSTTVVEDMEVMTAEYNS